MNKKVLITLGAASVAALAASNTGLADCGGLFLLHQVDKHFTIKSCSVKDSLSIENFEVHGSFYHTAVQARYSDSWDLKVLSKLNVASAGFESRYKYVTFGIDVNTFPMVQSRLSVHREDSLFRINASIARGNIDLGNISWIPDKETEEVGTISGDWETHFLYRHLSAESKIKDHYINLSLSYINTTPHNPDKEHYIRDSANVIVLGAQYRHDFSGSHIEAGYMFADADMTLYGIFHSEDSRKRFMYLPIDATLHLGFAKWEWEHLKTHLEYAHLSGTLHSNPNRFFETLAPNRALPASLIKGLSFSFLQKAFRVNADLNAFGALSGASYQWALGKRLTFLPSVGLDFYGASAKLDIDKKTETTKVFGTSNAVRESMERKLNSFGSILSLGGEIRKKGSVELSLDYGISQIIPFYLDYTKSNSGSEKDDSSTGLFRNGFATHLSAGVKF